MRLKKLVPLFHEFNLKSDQNQRWHVFLRFFSSFDWFTVISVSVLWLVIFGFTKLNWKTLYTQFNALFSLCVYLEVFSAESCFTPSRMLNCYLKCLEISTADLIAFGNFPENLFSSSRGTNPLLFGKGWQRVPFCLHVFPASSPHWI